jgi:replication factor C subunit 2/4
MASFFDLKARKAEAASNGTANPKDKSSKENARLQPWVEK